jgi:hypothetical protein
MFSRFGKTIFHRVNYDNSVNNQNNLVSKEFEKYNETQLLGWEMTGCRKTFEKILVGWKCHLLKKKFRKRR